MANAPLPANREEATKILWTLNGSQFLTFPNVRRVGVFRNGLYFQLKKNKSKANIVSIVLDSRGLYDIQFSYNKKPYSSLDHVKKTAKRAKKREELERYEGVPINELQMVLEEATGFC